MFKKTLKIWIVLVILLGVIVPAYSYAEEGAYEEGKPGWAFHSLFSKGGEGSSPAQKLTFTSEENAGQNLYYMILEKTEVTPNHDALRFVAQSYGFTLSEAQQALDFSPRPFLQKSSYMTQQEAFDRVAQFQEDFEKAREDMVEREKLKAEVSMMEIFANGELSDSGFDLVYDLDVIEKILFFKASKSDIYSEDKPSSEGPNEGDKLKDMASPTPYEGDSPTKTDTIPDIGISAEEAKAAERKGSKYQDLEETLTVNDDVDRDICASFDLAAIVENYDRPTTAGAGAGEAGTTSGGDGAGGDDSGAGDSSGEDDIGIEGTTEAESSDGGPLETLDDIYEEEQGLCLGEFICIKLDFIYKQASVYSDQDNCIQCHVEKINDKFDEAIKSSMMPSKVTGNLFESGKCKAGFDLPSFINLNLILVPMPPLIPKNDDLMQISSFEKEFNKFMNRYVPKGKSIFNFELDEEVTLEAMSYSNMQETQQELLEHIQTAQEDARNLVKEQVRALEKASEVSGQATLLKTLGAEMAQMNMYFTSFKQIFDQIYKPCFATANKQDVQ
ncbi:MAG: hypothetical protein ABH856_01165 [Patescibacteria group bacterium]